MSNRLKAISAVMIVLSAVFFLSILLNPWVFAALAVAAYIAILARIIETALIAKEGLNAKF